MKIFLDPGHGMSNRKPGRFDPGAVVRVGKKDVTEAEIVMEWANELRAVLQGMGHSVVRSRVDEHDPAPLGERVHTAKSYGCEVFISLHCNEADGKAHGTETYYRGAGNKALAERCNTAVVDALGMRDRGVKNEALSQHARLAVLNFPKACLVELGFIDHAQSRDKLQDGGLMLLACGALADAITAAEPMPTENGKLKMAKGQKLPA